MKLSFHGADRGVTGSCHLIECAGRRVLIDCGLYQGGRELDQENAEPFGFDPSSIDYLLLTHAHLDHCGRLPLLLKRGFRGEVITTAASRELCRLVLVDSAHLQEEEARRLSRRAARHKRHPTEIPPLYSILDALNAFELFGRTAAYEKPIQVARRIRATFYDAGHILGSASILLEIKEGDHARNVLFSGDLGFAGRPLLRGPTPPPQVDVAIMETTYGDRLHRPLQPSIDELYDAITDGFRRGGNVIIPTFALERAQELLYFLHEGVKSRRLDSSMNVFLDSPMAISATEIFKRHPECYDRDTAELFHQGKDPFHLPGLRFVREAADSIALNQIKGGAIFIAGAGMCTGGRVRHHLRHNLGREDATIIFVGFAARGTLARQIIDGAKNVTIFEEQIAVRAKIHTINGFSAHADQAQLLAWHMLARPQQTFLVHGEEEVMSCFAAKLTGAHVEMPQLHQSFDL